MSKKEQLAQRTIKLKWLHQYNQNLPDSSDFTYTNILGIKEFSMSNYIIEIQQLYNSINSLFKSLDAYPDIMELLLASKIKIEYELYDPEGRMLIDTSGDQIKVYSGKWPAEISSNIKLTMSSDTCHLYWLGEVNFMFASFKGDVKTDGDLGMLLKLLPLVKPLHNIYAKYVNKDKL